MSLAGLPFLVALLLLATIFFHLPGVRLRQGVLTLCNLGFLSLLIPNWATAAGLGGFLLSGYLLGAILRRWPSRALLLIYVVLLVATFLALKKYDFVTPYLPSSFLALGVSIIGLSYMLFRQIQYLVDTIEGQIEGPSAWDYFNFQIGLFTLLSGPIQRFQDFQAHWSQLRPVLQDNHAVRMAYLRLLIGVIKMTVVASFFFSLYQQSASALNLPVDASVHGHWGYLISLSGILYCYPVYLYLNFSGYCDIVIAGASLLGLVLPENFDRPYISRNVIDYWTRWHRTLGFWIRDYIFMSLYRGIAQRWPKHAEQMAFICYFVAFFLAGVWHGPTTNFVIYGLLQAIGVSAAKLWERHLINKRGRKGLKEYLASSKIRAVAIFATLQFECLSLLFFPTDLATTLHMLGTAWRALT